MGAHRRDTVCFMATNRKGDNMNGKQLFGMSLLSALCIAGGIVIGSSMGITAVADAGVAPPQPTAVNICVDKKTGAMRLPPNGRCLKAKETLTPFAAGPQGIQGLAGVAGSQGPMGPTGATGAAGSISGLRQKSISFYTGSFGGCSLFGQSVVTRVDYNSWNTYSPISSTTTNLGCYSATVYVP